MLCASLTLQTRLLGVSSWRLRQSARRLTSQGKECWTSRCSGSLCSQRSASHQCASDASSLVVLLGLEPWHQKQKWGCLKTLSLALCDLRPKQKGVKTKTAKGHKEQTPPPPANAGEQRKRARALKRSSLLTRTLALVQISCQWHAVTLAKNKHWLTEGSVELFWEGGLGGGGWGGI